MQPKAPCLNPIRTGLAPTKDPSARPTPTLTPLTTQQAAIGGKRVTILLDQYVSPFDHSAVQYLYAHADVLFIVESHPTLGEDLAATVSQLIQDPVNPPARIVDSIAALP